MNKKFNYEEYTYEDLINEMIKDDNENKKNCNVEIDENLKFYIFFYVYGTKYTAESNSNIKPCDFIEDFKINVNKLTIDYFRKNKNITLYSKLKRFSGVKYKNKVLSTENFFIYENDNSYIFYIIENTNANVAKDIDKYVEYYKNKGKMELVKSILEKHNLQHRYLEFFV